MCRWGSEGAETVSLRRFRTTQWYALVVLVAVTAVVVFLVASGTFDLSSDDDADPLALSTTTTDADTASETTAGDSAESTADSGSITAPTSGASVALDELFQTGDLRVLVTDSRFAGSVGEDVDDAVARGRFVVVSLTVRNTGPEPLSLADRLGLVDGAGRAFSPDAHATAVAARRDGNRVDAVAMALQPGLTLDLVVVFDVAEDAEDVRLRLRGGFVDVALEQ